MAQRLVTPEDLEKYPELISQGVSVNMYYDFDVLEAQDELDEEDEEETDEPEKPKKVAPKKKGKNNKK